MERKSPDMLRDITPELLAQIKAELDEITQKAELEQGNIPDVPESKTYQIGNHDMSNKLRRDKSSNNK